MPTADLRTFMCRFSKNPDSLNLLEPKGSVQACTGIAVPLATRMEDRNWKLTFVCPCIISITVYDDQQDATILAYLFIPNQPYMFRAMSSPIIRST